MQIPQRWLGLVLAGAVACGDDDHDPEPVLGTGTDVEIPPVTWVGEHLEYAPQDGAPEPCGGTLSYMDRFVELVSEAMGVEPRGPVVFVHGSDEAESPCADGDYGCTFRGGVYSRGVPNDHELVHGVRRQHGGSMRFFEEGSAMMFGDDLQRWPAAEGDLVEDMVAGSDRRLPGEWYPRAGHFAAWLHERYGPEVTTALLLQTDRDSTAGMAVTLLEPDLACVGRPKRAGRLLASRQGSPSRPTLSKSHPNAPTSSSTSCLEGDRGADHRERDGIGGSRKAGVHSSLEASPLLTDILRP